MPTADLAYDANHWAELILAEEITIWDTVPALMQLLVDQAGKPELLGDSLRLVMMSGDWIPRVYQTRFGEFCPKRTS
jgi:non-ribosomal peptide synthetase component F